MSVSLDFRRSKEQDEDYIGRERGGSVDGPHHRVPRVRPRVCLVGWDPEQRFSDAQYDRITEALD